MVVPNLWTPIVIGQNTLLSMGSKLDYTKEVWEIPIGINLDNAKNTFRDPILGNELKPLTGYTNTAYGKECVLDTTNEWRENPCQSIQSEKSLLTMGSRFDHPQMTERSCEYLGVPGNGLKPLSGHACTVYDKECKLDPTKLWRENPCESMQSQPSSETIKSFCQTPKSGDSSLIKDGTLNTHESLTRSVNNNPCKYDTVIQVHWLGELCENQRYEPVSVLSRTVIPGMSHMKVDLRPMDFINKVDMEGLEKLIVPRQYEEGIKRFNSMRVAWGPTHTSEWLQVANMGVDALVLDPGDVIAFVMCARSSWSFHDIDLYDDPVIAIDPSISDHHRLQSKRIDCDHLRHCTETKGLGRGATADVAVYGTLISTSSSVVVDDTLKVNHLDGPTSSGPVQSPTPKQACSASSCGGLPTNQHLASPAPRRAEKEEEMGGILHTEAPVCTPFPPTDTIEPVQDIGGEVSPSTPYSDAHTWGGARSCLTNVRHSDDIEKNTVTQRDVINVTNEGYDLFRTRDTLNPQSDKVRALSNLSTKNLDLVSKRKRVLDMGVTIDATEKCRSIGEVEALIDWCLKPEISNVISKDGKLDFTEGKTHNQKCSIETEGNVKIQAYPSKSNPTERAEILRQVEEKLAQGIIEKSSAPWSSNCVCINKNGKIRIAVDYRKLNSYTKKDNYLLPTVQELMDSIEGTHWFTTVDACQAYHQIPMETERDKDLTSFIVPGGGLYRYKYMPFGLCNAGAVWTRFIDEVLQGLRWNICLVYADDILINTKSPNVQDHIRDLDKVFSRLAKYNIKVKADKIRLGLKELPFLGQLVGVEGCRPDPLKTKAVTDLPIPKTVHELRRALGMFTYYRKYIPKFAEIAAPLYSFCGKNAQNKRNSSKQIDLGEIGLESFNKLKEYLTSEPILLRFPDWNAPFEVHCDASDVGIAAKLCQMAEGKERVVMYASKTLSKQERKYFAYEKEALGLVWALELFRHYLKQQSFTVVTDCRSLVYLKDKALNARIGRWMLRLQEFTFTIKHKAGSLIPDVDTLSRAPLPGTSPYSNDHVEELYDDEVEIPTFIKIATEALEGKTPIFKVDCENIHNQVDPDNNDHKDLENFLQNKTSPLFKCDKDLEGWDPEIWKQEQNNPKNKEITRLFKSFKQTSLTRNDFQINKDGLLVKTGDNNTQRVVVPESLKAFVIGIHHNTPLHAHQGQKRLYQMITSKYYWPSQRKDIARWVKSCLVCAKRKTPRPVTQGLTESSLAQYPFQIVGIDLVGKCLETSRGYTWILTIVDHFSRWPIAIPIPDRKASTIARALYEHLICEYGIPTKILSDQGKELIGEALKLVYDRWGIKRVQTGGYNPQANGACERFHRWLHVTMTQLFDRKSPDWDEYLPALLFAYRVSVNDATGYSPYMLTRGREATLPLDVVLQLDETSVTKDDYVEQMTSRLKRALDVTRRNQYENHIANYDRAPARTKPSFKQGDKVLIWGKAAKEARLEIAGDKRSLPTKWRNPWIGPAVFLKELTNTKCQVQLGTKILDFNYNRVTKFVPWDDSTLTTSKWMENFTSENNEVQLADEIKEILPGDIIFFKLENKQHDQPSHVVAKVIHCKSDGYIDFQWMGHYSKSDDKATFQPGWVDVKDNKEYYSNSKLHKNHIMYTGESTGTFIRIENILLHGEKALKHNGKLTAEARSFLARK